MSQTSEEFKDFEENDFGDDFGDFGDQVDVDLELDLQSHELQVIPERQVDFNSQILTTNSARSIYTQLHTTHPPNPLEFVYSLTRRQYLQTLGKPLNLDEIGLNKLPPLQLSINPNEKILPIKPIETQPQLGKDPDIDIEGVSDEIDRVDLNTLNLVNVGVLVKMRDNLQAHEHSINAQLTYNLEHLDSLKNDNTTYNTLISDLIKETNDKLNKNTSMRSKIQPKSINLMERTGSAGLWGVNKLPKTPPERVNSPVEIELIGEDKPLYSYTTMSLFGASKKQPDVNKMKDEIQQASALANAQQLINNMNNQCYSKCILKPSNALSSGEEGCLNNCMQRYMEAFNIISTTYVHRMSKERHEQGV
ncbi:hypothetical protein E3P77_03631 [Wallemia ichthyophaga]|nr:hypothetical protein E3P77_03631 [Wallemia ichthyophaga]